MYINTFLANAGGIAETINSITESFRGELLSVVIGCAILAIIGNAIYAILMGEQEAMSAKKALFRVVVWTIIAFCAAQFMTYVASLAGGGFS